MNMLFQLKFMVCYHGLIVVLTHSSWMHQPHFHRSSQCCKLRSHLDRNDSYGHANIQHLEQRNHFSFLSCWGQRAGSTSNIDVDIHHGSKGVRWLRPRANLIGGTPAYCSFDKPRFNQILQYCCLRFSLPVLPQAKGMRPRDRARNCVFCLSPSTRVGTNFSRLLSRVMWKTNCSSLYSTTVGR
jgi:hypothetical protein